MMQIYIDESPYRFKTDDELTVGVRINRVSATSINYIALGLRICE